MDPSRVDPPPRRIVVTIERGHGEKAGDLEDLVSLYEDGFMEIRSILVDSELTAEEQLDSIADIVFDDQDEGD